MASAQRSTTITGVIKAVTPAAAFDHQRGADICIAVSLSNRLLINICYRFPPEQRGAWENWKQLLKPEMTVELVIDKRPNAKCSHYEGIGTIRILYDGVKVPWFPVAESVFGSIPDDAKKLTRDEQIRWRMLLEEAKDSIGQEFSPSEDQARVIADRIDAAAAALPKASIFNWKKLIVECIVGISIDLGFGATVPEALTNVFKKLFESYFVSKLTSDEAQKGTLM